MNIKTTSFVYFDDIDSHPLKRAVNLPEGQFNIRDHSHICASDGNSLVSLQTSLKLKITTTFLPSEKIVFIGNYCEVSGHFHCLCL